MASVCFSSPAGCDWAHAADDEKVIAHAQARARMQELVRMFMVGAIAFSVVPGLKAQRVIIQNVCAQMSQPGGALRRKGALYEVERKMAAHRERPFSGNS
jgi:hypothetical protein